MQKKIILAILYIIIGSSIDSWLYPFVLENVPSPIGLAIVIAASLGEIWGFIKLVE